MLFNIINLFYLLHAKASQTWLLMVRTHLDSLSPLFLYYNSDSCIGSASGDNIYKSVRIDSQVKWKHICIMTNTISMNIRMTFV